MPGRYAVTGYNAPFCQNRAAVLTSVKGKPLVRWRVPPLTSVALLSLSDGRLGRRDGRGFRSNKGMEGYAVTSGFDGLPPVVKLDGGQREQPAATE